MKPADLVIAIAVPVLWGAGFAVAKGSLDEFPPLFLMGMRFTLAALVLVWFVRPLWNMAGRLALVTFFGGTLAYGLQFTGLVELDASTAVLVVQIEVVFAAVMASVFLRDHLTRRQWCAMVTALAGVALIAGEPRVQAAPIAFLMVVAGGVAWAAGQTMIKTLGPIGGLRLVAWFAAFAGPQMLVASLVVEGGQWQAVREASWSGWVSVAYLAIFMTALGYALWFRLIGRYRMNQIVPFILLVPVTSIVGGVFFLGETLSPWVTAGGVLVMASVAFIHLQQPNPPAAVDRASMTGRQEPHRPAAASTSTIAERQQPRRPAIASESTLRERQQHRLPAAAGRSAITGRPES